MNGRPLAGTIASAARWICGAQVTWRSGLPENRQTIFFANHTSHLDFVVLWASLPRAMREKTRPIAAQDYWETGVRRVFAVGVFNSLLVPRHRGESAREVAAKATIDHIAREMGERYSLIIFPEGTRGDGETVAPFKSGLYYLCLQKPHVQLVPAYLENLNRILPKGEFLPVPFISRVTFGAPEFFDPAESKASFIERMHQAVCELRAP
ncbi:MAG TPA: lysophospholipid acyltransferase family protein [Candidatus Cybelea sp.]|nr:lysophospholipid acyltransferase family protein [Candidatus Cybelea sp.]